MDYLNRAIEYLEQHDKNEEEPTHFSYLDRQ